MKKIISICAVVLSALITADASVAFQWTSAAGQAKTELGVNTAGNRIALLFVSTDASIDWNTTTLLKSTYGNDQFIGSVSVGLGGRFATAATTWGASGTGSGSYVGMYTYMVLVNSAYAAGITPETVAEGTYYGVSSIGQISGANGVLAQSDTTPPSSAQVFTDSDAFIQTSFQNVVPEPSTVALMLAGLGIVAMRMRRK